MKAKLTINIVDERKQAISDVSIILSYAKQRRQQFSNSDGQSIFNFNIELENKPYATCDLHISKPGYQKHQIIALQIFEASPSSLTIILTKGSDETSVIDDHQLLRDDAYVE